MIHNQTHQYLLGSLVVGLFIARNQIPRLWTYLPPRLAGKINDHQPMRQITQWPQGHDELENNRQMAFKILDTTPGYLALLDTGNGCFPYSNPQFAAFFGCTKAASKDFRLKMFESAIHPDDTSIYHDFYTRLHGGSENLSLQTEVRVLNVEEQWRWMTIRGVVIASSDTRPGNLIILSGEDTTENRATYDQLHYASTHDALTGLYNWAYFVDTLTQVQKEGLFPVAVVMMDMDNLKTINDTQGHHTGDKILHEIGALLKDSFRACDVVARVGGDEFAVLLSWVNEHDALEIVQRVQSRFAQATTQSGMSLDVLSFGVCIANNASELSEAHHLADRRMYQDKLRRKSKMYDAPRKVMICYEDMQP